MDKIVNGLRIWPIRSIQTMWRVRQRVHTLCSGGCNQTNRRTEPHSIISIVVDGKLKNKSFANALTEWMLVQSSAEKKTPYYTDSFNYNQSKMMKNTLAQTHTQRTMSRIHISTAFHIIISLSLWVDIFPSDELHVAHFIDQPALTLKMLQHCHSMGGFRLEPIRCKNQDAHA